MFIHIPNNNVLNDTCLYHEKGTGHQWLFQQFSLSECCRCSSPLDQPSSVSSVNNPWPRGHDVGLPNRIPRFEQQFFTQVRNDKQFGLGNLDVSVPIHVFMKIPLARFGNSPLRRLSLWALWTFWAFLALWTGGPGEQTYCDTIDTMICIPVRAKGGGRSSQIGNR